jgi:sulfur transfer protein SufE
MPASRGAWEPAVRHRHHRNGQGGGVATDDVSGLVFLALRVYSGRPAAEISATEPEYISAIGLSKHLSPTRSNGLAALLDFIHDAAKQAT